MANPLRSPSQTIGPFFHEALRWKDGEKVRFAEKGEAIVLAGHLYDGAGETLADSLIETWQLSPAGKPPAPASGESLPHGLGRVETNKAGAFRIETLMPGAPEGHAPCIDVTVFARGLLRPLRTRVYFADESRVRAEPILKPISGSHRVKTLVATREGHSTPAVYRWDIRLQGVGETVFFAF
jgi:protocatechuate 3,4-dioxygenase alpha subunit